ncbi:DDB1- and CUL4-associated factor 4 isoform X1 [Pantherophis guttatus]|uniref:DDB1- and CUL4-associated factor 4 isoform X1 n=5 Tax=Pantherophis guttatus TaxID=94885 RepID=A0A6P9C1K3_PANGU|nr:DDB1- and CUL4-associated factor 4 isoform X1 [Pantherophis guttatus]
MWEMKRTRWRGRRNHVQYNHRRMCNGQPYTVFHHQHSTERPEQRELQSLQNSGRSQAETPSASSHSCQSSSVPELPGFYYDPEKNRYFRLLPGHNNCNPLTKESIHQKEMEKQRLRLLKEDEKMIKKTPRSGLNSSIILRKKQLGFYSSITYCRLIHELKVNCMQRRKLQIESLNSSVSGSNNFKLIVADTASERMIAVNDAEQGGSKYGIVDLRGLGKDSLTVEMYDNPCFTNRKVNSACWASVRHQDSHVLLCLMGAAENVGCTSLLPASFFSSSNTAVERGMSWRFNITTAWSCAWCHNPQANNCFSTGLSQRIIVTNAATGHHQTFNTNSDVLVQQFATQSPVLYNGCRSGEIFSIDVRQCNHKGQRWKAGQFFHDSAITSVNLLKNEQYLMAADMLGQIKLWDLRKLKCVKEYSGHKNEHTILPLHINEEEGLLSAVGQDCYTRIWSLQDAHLLRTIPSPSSSSRDSIPSVVFSSQLGGARGVPGLLMAVRQDLYYFSYKTDDPYCLHIKDMDCSTLHSD